MNIIFSKARFLEKLTPAMGTVSSKNTIASIEGVLIETVGDHLRLSTYDMKKGTVSEMECDEVKKRQRDHQRRPPPPNSEGHARGHGGA